LLDAAAATLQRQLELRRRCRHDLHTWLLPQQQVAHRIWPIWEDGSGNHNPHLGQHSAATDCYPA